MQTCSSNAQCVDYGCCSRGFYYSYDPISKKSAAQTQSACNVEESCMKDDVGLFLILALAIISSVGLAYILINSICNRKEKTPEEYYGINMTQDGSSNQNMIPFAGRQYRGNEIKENKEYWGRLSAKKPASKAKKNKKSGNESDSLNFNAKDIEFSPKTGYQDY